MHILLIEDDDRVAAALRPALHRHGMTTTRLDHGRGVTDHLDGVDVVLLDLGLPDTDGLDVCRAIRAVSEVPVLMVTARGEITDRIEGLHTGADDYLVKPYDIGELVARVHAVQRRRKVGTDGVAAPAGSGPVTVGDVRVDPDRHAVTVADTEVVLTRKEFQVLALLARADGAVCTRAQIVAEVWGRGWAGANRTLDVHVATLRTKLGRPELIRTVRGVGYRFAATED